MHTISCHRGCSSPFMYHMYGHVTWEYFKSKEWLFQISGIEKDLTTFGLKLLSYPMQPRHTFEYGNSSCSKPIKIHYVFDFMIPSEAWPKALKKLFVCCNPINPRKTCFDFIYDTFRSLAQGIKKLLVCHNLINPRKTCWLLLLLLLFSIKKKKKKIFQPTSLGSRHEAFLSQNIRTCTKHMYV